MASWNILLEPDKDGQTTATVVEMPTFNVTASTRKTALAKIQQLLTERLAHAEVVSISVPTLKPEKPEDPLRTENPWAEFGGLFQGDQDFEGIVQTMQAERLPH